MGSFGIVISAVVAIILFGDTLSISDIIQLAIVCGLFSISGNVCMLKEEMQTWRQMWDINKNK